MLDIYTHAHTLWQSPVCAVGQFMFWGDRIKPPATIAGVYILLLKFCYLFFSVRCYVIDAKFCENQILFDGVMKICSGVYFSPDIVYMLTVRYLSLHHKYNSILLLLRCTKLWWLLNADILSGYGSRPHELMRLVHPCTIRWERDLSSIKVGWTRYCEW